MARLEQEVFVDAPPERVFAVLAQPERTPEWWPSVIAVRRTSPGQIGLGSTTESTMTALGRRQRAVGRCTVFDPPRRLTVETRTELGARSISDSELAAEGAGTRLRATLIYRLPGGIFGRFFDDVVVQRQTRQEFEEALLRLKQLIEAANA